MGPWSVRWGKRRTTVRFLFVLNNLTGIQTLSIQINMWLKVIGRALPFSFIEFFQLEHTDKAPKISELPLFDLDFFFFPLGCMWEMSSACKRTVIILQLGKSISLISFVGFTTHNVRFPLDGTTVGSRISNNTLQGGLHLHGETPRCTTLLQRPPIWSVWLGFPLIVRCVPGRRGQ